MTIIITICKALFLITHADIDECLESPCDQECGNSDGGFECICERGYVLDTDERSCLGMCVYRSV